jgi:O-antigen/teichoic acid export membrane protein
MTSTAEPQEAAPAEHRTPSLLGRLLRLAPVQGASTVLDQFLVSGGSFATSVIIGRLLSRADLGTYSLALSVVQFLRGVQGELVNSPYTVHCHRMGEEERAKCTGSVLALHACLTVAGMAILAVLAVVCGSGRGPAGLAPVFAVLAALLPFLLLRECFRLLSLARFRVVAVLVLDGTVTALQVAALLLLARFGFLSLPAVFAAIGGSCAMGCVVWLVAGRLPMRFDPGQVRADWRRSWSFGKWTLAGFLLVSTTPTLVPWLLAAAHGKEAAGVLAACTTLVNLAGVYVTGVGNVLSPLAARAFTRGGWPELRTVLRRTGLLYVVSLSAFCLVVFLTGDLATRLIYGSRYHGTATILRVLSVAMLVNSLGITAGNGLWALHRPEANVAADVTSLVATLSVVLLLVWPLGPLGAAVGLLVGMAAGALVRWLTLWRCARPMEIMDLTARENGLGPGGPIA